MHIAIEVVYLKYFIRFISQNNRMISNLSINSKIFIYHLTSFRIAHSISHCTPSAEIWISDRTDSRWTFQFPLRYKNIPRWRDLPMVICQLRNRAYSKWPCVSASPRFHRSGKRDLSIKKQIILKWRIWIDDNVIM